MRLKEITAAHQRLLRDLTNRISTGLETEFSELPGEDGPNVGITLRERRKHVTIEVPATLLAQAADDLMAREAMRVRIKARRDRMLFQPPPSRLPKNIASTPPLPQGFGRGGYGPRR